jgi:hypothetical protein
VAGSCEYSDEPSGSGAMALDQQNVRKRNNSLAILIYKCSLIYCHDPARYLHDVINCCQATKYQ